MTICVGFIPNDRTAMLIQDSEITYTGIDITQDIYRKIKQIDNKVIAGVIGSGSFGNEVIDLLSSRICQTSAELRANVDEAYNRVREEKFQKAILRKYGFTNIREVTNPPKETFIDQSVREDILKSYNDQNNFNLSIMVASVFDRPEIYTSRFPGFGSLENNVKMYAAAGSGAIMAIDKMGEELERYKWHKDLTIDQGIEVLMRAGKESEKHVGVGGPFDITYVTKDSEGIKIISPEQRKINMVMYLHPLEIEENIMNGAICKMRDENTKPIDLADFIKKNTGVGIEFDKYFGL